jgi:DNA-binding NarL/FixJ family response regulator
MAVFPNRVLESKLFSSWGEGLGLSSNASASASRETDTTGLQRYILPRDLDAAVRRLDDQELDRLISAALRERSRRRKPSLPEKAQRTAEAEAVTLPQGKLNAVLAAFKAGVSPTRIAREFGLSKSDVQRTLAAHSRRR